MKPSTGLRNTMLSGGSLKSALDGGEIRVYDGDEPAGADDAIGNAILLCTIKNGANGLTFGAAVGGVMQKNAGETWSGINGNTGTAKFYRHVTAADGGQASNVLPRLQGKIGLAGADINFTSVALASGAVQPLNFYSVPIPA